MHPTWESDVFCQWKLGLINIKVLVRSLGWTAEINALNANTPANVGSKPLHISDYTVATWLKSNSLHPEHIVQGSAERHEHTVVSFPRLSVWQRQPSFRLIGVSCASRGQPRLSHSSVPSIIRFRQSNSAKKTRKEKKRYFVLQVRLTSWHFREEEGSI